MGSSTGTAEVSCRFHDLRHTACARMLESGAALEKLEAAIEGTLPTA
ncbi:MAG: hypothetical protein ACRD1I_07555 [Terriglobia bacterium]